MRALQAELAAELELPREEVTEWLAGRRVVNTSVGLMMGKWTRAVQQEWAQMLGEQAPPRGKVQGDSPFGTSR